MSEGKKKRSIRLVTLVGVIIIAIIIIACIFTATRKITVKNIADFSTEDGMTEFINKVMEQIKDELPEDILVSSIDRYDQDALKYYTGLENPDNIDTIVAADSISSSEAYSFILVKLSDNANKEDIKNEIFNNVDSQKWINAQADQKYATDYDNTIIFVISERDLAEKTYNQVTSLLKNQNGKVLSEKMSEGV